MSIHIPQMHFCAKLFPWHIELSLKTTNPTLCIVHKNNWVKSIHLLFGWVKCNITASYNIGGYKCLLISQIVVHFEYNTIHYFKNDKLAWTEFGFAQTRCILMRWSNCSQMYLNSNVSIIRNWNPNLDTITKYRNQNQYHIYKFKNLCKKIYNNRFAF